ncbi:tyrosine-type recombinase/integrase [Methylomonas paludis]|uniref:Tyrosine-type recombinase/integrase n=1 Tax=Methylomonas paludis TaxID=1173101 RepID=A0A975MLI9_9GAMM|nr:integrase arm-type DNA-binding domain-containing protein [Methylomonas paludis]QWF70088.1 tyrosine-type recombinase/integrase [Methylomonas paludis]
MAINLNKDVVYRAAKPKEKDYTINDGGGLALLIKASGSKLWRFIYRFDGKQNRLGLGAYPDLSLEAARNKAKEPRENLANGIDPGDQRKQTKEAKRLAADKTKRLEAGLPIINSFEHICNEWLESIAHGVRAITQQKKIRRFELYVFPFIGSKPISEIKSPDIHALIKPLISKNQLETAHRVNSEISAAYAYAIAHGHTDYDPAQAVAKQIPAQKVKHNAAVTEPKEVAQLLRDIGHYQGTFVVQCALRLSPYLFQRPGEIRQMEWQDIDLDAKEWRYFVTKTEVQHIVPLSSQAIAILEAIKPLTGTGRYVFPSSRGDGRPMSDGTIRTALKTLGYESDVMSAHGFRTTASTLLNEQGWSPDAIERQLCHMPRDAVRAAYNRAQYLEERRRMMQSWADYLDGLKAGAQVIPFRKTI